MALYSDQCKKSVNFVENFEGDKHTHTHTHTGIRHAW